MLIDFSEIQVNSVNGVPVYSSILRIVLTLLISVVDIPKLISLSYVTIYGKEI